MSSQPNAILMTQAQYARHRNQSPQYIGELAEAGVLVMGGRLVDVAATDAVLDDKPQERPAPDGQQPASYAQAKLADMVFRGKLRRLEVAVRNAGDQLLARHACPRVAPEEGRARRGVGLPRIRLRDPAGPHLDGPVIGTGVRAN
jgi:hypothetical protein